MVLATKWAVDTGGMFNPVVREFPLSADTYPDNGRWIKAVCPVDLAENLGNLTQRFLQQLGNTG